MGRKSKEIKAVLYIPENGRHLFEEKVSAFYAAQVEKKLHSYHFTKQQKLEILQLLVNEYNIKV